MFCSIDSSRGHNPAVGQWANKGGLAELGELQRLLREPRRLRAGRRCRATRRRAIPAEHRCGCTWPSDWPGVLTHR